MLSGQWPAHMCDQIYTMDLLAQTKMTVRT
jgi:hypothetical protein